MAYNMHKTPNHRGFSLIEILVAITILAFLMLGVYSLVDNSAQTQMRVVEEDDRLLQMETAMARFELDYTHLYTPIYHSVPYTSSNQQDPGATTTNSFEPPQLSSLKKYKPTERFPAISKKGAPIPIIQQEDAQSMVVMTMVHQRKVENAKQSNYAWVKYSLRTMQPQADEEVNAEANQEWVRQYTADNPYAEFFDWDDVPEQVILKHIKKLEIKFYNKVREKYVDNIRDLNGELPRLMEVTLEWAEVNNIITTTARYFRVLWPEFDTKADDQELMKVYLEIHRRLEENKKAKNPDNNVDPNPADPPDPEGE
jgi:prepilin-type N-terminal cleavage/methylation domain-containing protein